MVRPQWLQWLSARQTPLAVVLEGLGYRLQPTGQGNCIVLDLPGEDVFKQHHWVRLEDGTAGNSMDFFVRPHGKSFTEDGGLLLEKSSLPTAS